jgi:hypothetical protein
MIFVIWIKKMIFLTLLIFFINNKLILLCPEIIKKRRIFDKYERKIITNIYVNVCGAFVRADKNSKGDR